MQETKRNIRFRKVFQSVYGRIETISDGIECSLFKNWFEGVMAVVLNETAAEPTDKARSTVRQWKRFRVEIDPKLCKGCYFCIRCCPMGVFSRSDEIGKMGYVVAKVEHPEKCTGCRLCLVYCPDFATSVEEERKDKN